MKRLPLALLLATTLLLATAGTAGAVVVMLNTFRMEIDVKLNVTQHSSWHGIAPGCYAPQEKFDTALTARLDSTPSSRSKIKAGTATLLPGSFGATSSFGAKASFRQSAKSGPWELQTQNPASCNLPAPAVPSWATSPTCKKVSERVMASLIQHDTDGDANSPARITDGSLLLMRVTKPNAKSRGASIGDSCLRSLRGIDAVGIDSELDFMSRNTFMQIPVPKLKPKLERLAKGSARSRPSVKIPIKFGGDCTAMTMQPSIGDRPGFQQSIGSTPHNALGNIFGDWSKSPCTVSGSGRAILRRVGPVVSTGRVR